MKTIFFIALLLLPRIGLAQSPPSDTPADKCVGLAKACSAAARELKAARELIAGLQDQIAASDQRINLAKKEIESLKQIGALESERAKELESVIAAEKEQVALLLKRIELQQQRINQLEKQLGRARKVGLIAGIAAAVGIVIAIGK